MQRNDGGRKQKEKKNHMARLVATCHLFIYLFIDNNNEFIGLSCIYIYLVVEIKMRGRLHYSFGMLIIFHF